MQLSVERTKKTGEDCLIIAEKYIMYPDGVVYNANCDSEIIPGWIFKFRDYILKNANKMKNV